MSRRLSCVLTCPFQPQAHKVIFLQGYSEISLRANQPKTRKHTKEGSCEDKQGHRGLLKHWGLWNLATEAERGEMCLGGSLGPLSLSVGGSGSARTTNPGAGGTDRLAWGVRDFLAKSSGS